MSEENGIYISLLLEFYGMLLTSRQRELVSYTFNDDLSLSEIAELTEITRQGVRDGVRKAVAQLEMYEEKLGMYRAYLQRQKDAERLLGLVDCMAEATDPKLAEIKELIRAVCS